MEQLEKTGIITKPEYSPKGADEIIAYRAASNAVVDLLTESCPVDTETFGD